jgi:choline monooxygenase
MNVENYQFDDRLAFAKTIPASWYFDPAMLAREKETVFAHTWQLVGRSEQVAVPGAYFTTTIADEPIVVVRGADEKLRALSNVCRHRAGPVAEGAGQRKVLQCSYHGWTYMLDGRLHGTPEFEGVEGFDKARNCLLEFSVDEWAGLVFVNLDNKCEPLLNTLEDLPARLLYQEPHQDLTAMKFALRKDWYVNCNWKVYVDNYLEGYHIPLVHPGLNRELDYANYRTETRRFYSIQHSPIKPNDHMRLRMSEDATANQTQFFWLFPNLMLNVYPDNYSTNLIVPLGPERTLTIFEWFFHDPESEAVQEKLRRTVEFSDEIQIEDIRICEAVQRNLHSRTYSTGRYSVQRENGVHHFHGLLTEFLQTS